SWSPRSGSARARGCRTGTSPPLPVSAPDTGGRSWRPVRSTLRRRRRRTVRASTRGGRGACQSLFGNLALRHLGERLRGEDALLVAPAEMALFALAHELIVEQRLGAQLDLGRIRRCVALHVRQRHVLEMLAQRTAVGGAVA